MSTALNNLVMEDKRREGHTRLAIGICFASPIIIVAICFIISCILRS